MARRHLAGILIAGFERRPWLAVEDRDLVAVMREVVGDRSADHTAAQDHYVHWRASLFGDRALRVARRSCLTLRR
jgi:hypothetical protein